MYDKYAEYRPVTHDSTYSKARAWRFTYFDHFSCHILHIILHFFCHIQVLHILRQWQICRIWTCHPSLFCIFFSYFLSYFAYYFAYFIAYSAYFIADSAYSAYFMHILSICDIFSIASCIFCILFDILCIFVCIFLPNKQCLGPYLRVTSATPPPISVFLPVMLAICLGGVSNFAWQQFLINCCHTIL